LGEGTRESEKPGWPLTKWGTLCGKSRRRKKEDCVALKRKKAKEKLNREKRDGLLRAANRGGGLLRGEDPANQREKSLKKNRMPSGEKGSRRGAERGQVY